MTCYKARRKLNTGKYHQQFRCLRRRLCVGYYPGQDQDIKQRKAAVEGIEIVDDIYQYLIS